METIADIVAEMRAKTAKSKDEAWYDKDKWAELCNRIEMAWEREAKAIATENAVLPAVCITKPVDNAAKIREALEQIREMPDEYFFGVTVNKDPEVCLVSCSDIADAALASPPRNCDLYTNYGDALRAFEDDEDAESYEDIGDWLFAEAKGAGNEQ